MRIEFVNHASFVIQSAGAQLLCDPWLRGTAFNDGWSLLSPTVFRPEDFGRITHLWLSHEHPDHFSPPTLKMIPTEARSRIEVLFQKTADRRVVDFCAKLGFRAVVELEPDQPREIAPGFTVLCNPAEGFEDSWLFATTPEGTVLNVNDCPLFEPDEINRVKRQLGHIDVLFTQFAISAWDGREDQPERRQAGARSMLERAVRHAQLFEPRYVVPFASFLWFCHEENFYMNEVLPSVDTVAQALRAGSSAEPVVLYPGDVWDVGQPFDSRPSTAKYVADRASIGQRERLTSASVDRQALIAASREFCSVLVNGSDESRLRLRWALRSAKRVRADRGRFASMVRFAQLAALRIDPVRIWVTDHAASYTFDPIGGLSPAAYPESACDIALSSDSLHYAFKFTWGGMTLYINGRFRELEPEARNDLFRYFGHAFSRTFGATDRWDQLPSDLARWGKRMNEKTRAALRASPPRGGSSGQD